MGGNQVYFPSVVSLAHFLPKIASHFLCVCSRLFVLDFCFLGRSIANLKVPLEVYRTLFVFRFRRLSFWGRAFQYSFKSKP